MINTFAMQSRGTVIPASCKMLYKCNERSGFPVNSITGHAYDPDNLVVADPANDGYIDFVLDNAITFQSNTSGISVVTELDAVLSTRKVIIAAACILPLDGGGHSKTRIAMGALGDEFTGISPVISVSFSTTMHAQISTDATANAGYYVHTTPDATALITAFTDPLIIYVMWNGLGSSASVNGTLIAKALTTNGAVYSNGVTPSSQSAAGLLTADTITVGNMMRPNSARYYKMEAWELDHLPQNLDLKLAQWGNLAINGYKGAIDLK